MNNAREDIMKEILERCWKVSGVTFVIRNPKKEPEVGDLPFIGIFELDDNVVESSKRGKYFIYKRVLEVIIEPFILATSDGAASTELTSFVDLLKKVLYTDGVSLGKRCEVSEAGSGKVLRPPVDANAIGISLRFKILYIENVESLFT